MKTHIWEIFRPSNCYISTKYCKTFSDISNAENVPNGMFLECFIGLTEVTKERCCYG